MRRLVIFRGHGQGFAGAAGPSSACDEPPGSRAKRGAPAQALMQSGLRAQHLFERRRLEIIATNDNLTGTLSNLYGSCKLTLA